jgi:hypothetical protein
MTDKLLSLFIQKALKESLALDQNSIEIEMIGLFPHCARSPYLTQVICSPYVHVQLESGATGICFAYKEIENKEVLHLIGENARVAIESSCLEAQIAIVDAIYGQFNKANGFRPRKSIEIRGRPSEKALERARIIASMVQAQKTDRIGIIGCVEPMIYFIKSTGCEIRIADIHSPYKSILGITVEKESSSILDWANKIVVTGSALWTQTIAQILSKASERSIFTVVFAMTGHNIAPHYLDYGANIVVSELFPYYWFAGTTSKLELYANNPEEIKIIGEMISSSAAVGQKNGTPLARQRRPFQIALLDLGQLTNLNIPQLAQKLNSLQQIFHYAAVTPVDNLGDYDELHWHSYEKLFSLVHSHTIGTKFRYGIGIIHERLPRDSFNFHDIERGTGVITVADAEQYNPPGKTLEQYAAYLILCETFNLVGGIEFEHPEVHYCLFDLCQTKANLINCIKKARIEDDCLVQLGRAGFNENDIVAAKMILNFVAKTNVTNVILKSLNNPIVGILCGGLIIQIIGNYFYDLPEPWPLVTLVVTAVGLVLAIALSIWNNRKRR